MPSLPLRDADGCRYDVVRYGAAHGALARTTPGDTSMATAAEVVALASGTDAAIVR
ncbi:hypothetical protein AB0F72_31595 [Actinoplanes sp. NPDC023936]|uniref:hypothetical protein n=1 Tax=Actinoplanes sp. NPDC023936 TaxID=3154910 RepID=UPI0033E5DFB6